MGDTVTVRNERGDLIDVPADQLGGAIAHGYTPEASDARTDRLASDVQHETYGGLAGGILAGGAGLARGASLGLSDVAFDAVGGEDAQRSLRGLRDENPYLSTGGQILGGVALGEFGGIGAGISSRLSGLAEAGAAGRVAAGTLAAAGEGSVQNAGAYISDVALGDRNLSADGFVGAMGDGALWGGVAGGALSLSSEAMTAARRLFPAADMTAEGATAARSTATQAVRGAVDDSAELTTAAETKLKQLADQEAIANPSFKQQRDAIRLQAEQEMADARVARETAKTEGEAAKAKVAKLKADQVESKLARRGKPSGKSILDDLASIADESSGPPVEGPSLLERQLQGTKQLVDQGQSLVDIRVNQALAKANPEAAKLVDALGSAKQSSDELGNWLDKYGAKSDVGKFERNQATRDYAAGMRNKGEGWQSQVPDGEGTIGLPRGTRNEWRGSEEGRAQWEKDFEAGKTKGHYGGISSDEQSMADSAIDDITLRRLKRGGIQAPSGDEILDAAEPASAKVEKALKAKSADINDDIAETAPMITRHEAAHADLADALGVEAPPASQTRTQEFRKAQSASAGKASDQVSVVAAAAAKIPAAMSNVGATYEALRMMGVPLPDPHAVPVIGPLLSAYLKAKVIGKAFGRFGGQVGSTAETTIAEKAAMVRQRVYRAADAGLAAGARSTAGLAQRAGVAAVLGHKLFDDGAPPMNPQPYTSEPAKGSIESLYLARAAEIDASQKPGAIQQAIQQRIHASDPDAVAAIVATKERQLAYIASKMPRPVDPPGVLDTRMWTPAKQDLARWSQCIGAVNDPAGVMERAVHGLASADEIDAVKTVYPALYADGQKRVIDKLATGAGRDLTTVQRTTLSRAWGMPLSGPPDRTAWMQQSYQPTPPAPQPAGPLPQPTISGPVTIGQRTLTTIDGG